MICIALYDEDINEAGSMETLLYEIGNRNKISVEITVFCSEEENELIGKILISEILYFESNSRQINAYIINGCTETFSGQLKNIEKRLKNIKIPFLRIHQSYIVNFHMIRAYSKCKVRMVNGDVLSISSSYQRKFYEWYGTHIGDTQI